jgi:hypothetical protein
MTWGFIVLFGRTPFSIVYAILCVIVIIYIVSAIYNYIERKKCPNCKKYFARKLIKKGNDEYAQQSDRSDILATYRYVCKFCNHRWR